MDNSPVERARSFTPEQAAARNRKHRRYLAKINGRKILGSTNPYVKPKEDEETRRDELA